MNVTYILLEKIPLLFEGVIYADLRHASKNIMHRVAHNSAETANRLTAKAQEEYDAAYGDGAFLRDFGRNYKS